MERISVLSKGISASVSIGGNFLDIEEDGYVGKLTPGMAEIYLWIHPGSVNLWGVDVDGRKNMQLRRNLSTSPALGKYYRQKIQIKESLEPGVYHTEYPINNLRVLQLASDGALEVWLATLFSQNGEFFLTIQRTEQARCYQGVYGVECPRSRYGGRNQNLTFFAQLLGEKIKDLPSIDEFRPDPEPMFTFKPGVNKGVVRWFTDAEGTGAIEVLQGIGKTAMARVHWSQIAKRGRRAYLREGEGVTFEALRSPEQTSGRETTFKLEAVGVTVV